MAQFNAFDVMEVTLGAALANGGTQAFTYPTASPARAAASYKSASGAKLVASRGFQGNFAQGASNFSLVYGASTVTLTYLGSTTIPAGTKLTLQAPLIDYEDITDNTGGAIGRTAAAGVGIQTLAFFMNLADIANGDLLTNYVPGYRFKILKADFRVLKPVTTGAKLATLNLEIGTTNLTGGAIALTSANCTPAGVAVAGTAITADNVGTATDSFSVEASSVTTFVEGNGWLLVSIQNMDDADAFASVIDAENKANAVLRGREIYPGQVAN